MGRRTRVVVVVALAVAGWGCASEADTSSPELQSVIDAAADTAEERSTRDDAMDAAVEQMVDLGDDGIADDATAEEQRCIEEHPDLDGIDFRTIMTDPDAIEQRVTLARVLLDCIPRPEVFAPLFANALRATSVDLSERESTCLLGEVLENANDPARLLVVADSVADLQVFLSAMEECLTPEHFAEFSGEPGTGPQAYGDDDRLDSIHDDCSDGELRACDLLWLVANQGSAYQEHAATCGGTAEDTGEFCSEEAELNDTGFAAPDSPGLEVLATDCEDGDLTACDLLYQLVPMGHRLENVGFTCGGRIAVGAVPDCRTRFG